MLSTIGRLLGGMGAGGIPGGGTISTEAHRSGRVWYNEATGLELGKTEGERF